MAVFKSSTCFRAFLVALVILSLCVSCGASEATRSDTQLSDSDENLSRQVAELMFTETMWQDVLPVMHMQTVAEMEKAVADSSAFEEHAHIVAQAYGRRMQPLLREVFSRELILRVYSEFLDDKFTGRELAEIRDFYRSEAGKKLVEQGVELEAIMISAVTAEGSEKLPEFMEEITDQIVRDTDTDIAARVWAAHKLIADEELPQELLGKILEVSESGIEWRPKSALTQDLAAMARYRTLDFVGAIEAGRNAARAEPSRFYTSKVARYEHAHLEQEGPRLRGIEPGGPLPTVDLVQANDSEEGDKVFEVQTNRRFERGAIVHALALDDGELIGTFQLAFGAKHRNDYRFIDADGGHQRLPDSVSFEVSLVDVESVDMAPDGWTWKYYKMSPRVQKLPKPSVTN